MDVTLRCPACEGEFDHEVEMDGDGPVLDLPEQCPHCHETFTETTQELFATAIEDVCARDAEDYRDYRADCRRGNPEHGED